MIVALGYTVKSAESAAQAIQFLVSDTPVDLLLTDVVMPGGVDGFQLAQRARELRSDLPVICMSGYFGFSDEDMGPVRAPLIQKPSTPAEISATITSVLDAHSGS